MQDVYCVIEYVFYFIEYDVLIVQVFIFEGVVLFFLFEVQVVQCGEKGCIQIDVEQIKEICFVGVGEWVDGVVCVCYCVYECCSRVVGY